MSWTLSTSFAGALGRIGPLIGFVLCWVLRLAWSTMSCMLYSYVCDFVYLCYIVFGEVYFVGFFLFVGVAVGSYV